MTEEAIQFDRQRELMLEYVKMKIDTNDLHGAIDGLMDIREIDAVRAALEKWQKNPQSEYSLSLKHD